MSKSPTQMTLERCREMGWEADVAERWIYGGTPGLKRGRRKDLFGFIDVVCLTPTGILGLQVTSGSNVPSRVHKIQNECRHKARAWLASGGKIEVWGWRKRPKRGADNKWWHLRREPVVL